MDRIPILKMGKLRLGRVEKELREVDRRKDEFLAVLAHELRNPLGPIRNAVELLRHLDPYVAEKQENARQTIVRQTDHMVRLVDDLLDISCITKGKITPHKQPVELKAFINAGIETAGPMIEERQHSLKVCLPEHEIWIAGDSVRLSQIVGNLLHNAAKFTPRTGALNISAEPRDGSIVIQVQDNGIGISPERMQSIFDLFVQAEHAPDRMQDGLGIGLSLVKSLVELHDGTVTVTSPGVGQGSRFELRLPMMAAEPASSSPQEAIRQGDHDSQRILVVDDNADSADIISTVLELDGHTVQRSYSGAAAVESASRFQPEVVLLDIGLPDMSGFEVAARLRELPGMNSAVLIALIGYGQEKNREQARQAGFDHHLTKPVAMDTLLRAIRNPARRAGLNLSFPHGKA